jgi:predicted RNase H-like HicB family nuclease
MQSIGFTFWEDGGTWLGYLDDYPDYMTQGTSIEDLQDHLRDLYHEFTSSNIPGVRQHAELRVG